MTVTAQKYVAFNCVEKSEGITWSLQFMRWQVLHQNVFIDNLFAK